MPENMGEPRPFVAFRPGPLLADLEQRAGAGREPTESLESLGLTARRDLERYYALLHDERRSVRLRLAEALLVCDALNGAAHDASTYRLLWASVADAIEAEGLDHKWGVDGPALVTTLRALTPGQTLAVLDAVERWWHHPHRDADRAAALRAVGLVRRAADPVKKEDKE